MQFHKPRLKNLYGIVQNVQIYNEDDLVSESDLQGFRDLLNRCLTAVQKMEAMTENTALPNPYPINIKIEGTTTQYTGSEEKTVEIKDVAYISGDYDPETDSIEIGCSIERKSWGRGFAGEAVKAVLSYLTEHEGIRCVKAWCAADNIGSRTIMERAGMKCTRVEPEALESDGHKYDKMDYET